MATVKTANKPEVDTSAPPATEMPATRLAFDVEFMARTEEFCNQIMAAIPELSGIALIPLWTVHPENAQNGLLSLRNKQPPYTASLLNLLRRLAAFNVDVHNDLINQIRMLDQYAAHVAEQIRLRQDELNNTTTPPAANDE